MPKLKWNGYQRFCPLARGLDIVGERWTLLIMQELLSSPKRYTDLQRRLPGIGTSVLADRLRKLEQAGLVSRRPGKVGEAIQYVPTEAGTDLEPVLQAIREWGVRNLVSADEATTFNMTFIEQIELLPHETYEWHVGDTVTNLTIQDGKLTQREGTAVSPTVIVHTTPEFMQRWASGQVNWDDGIASGQVQYEGTSESWQQMLAATGYLNRYEPERMEKSDE